MVDLSSRVLLILFFAALPAFAQLQGGTLESGPSLKHGGLKTSRLERGQLKASPLRGAKLESARPQEGAGLLKSATLKRKATELTTKGFGTKALQGAVSTIPRSQVGELLYDVASLLQQDELTKDVAIGYYMAVLADPLGARHDDALARLKEIFLKHDLQHTEAVGLYDSGLETMKGLIAAKIGLTEEGFRAGLYALQEVKIAYHNRRKQEMDETSVGSNAFTEKDSEAEVEGPVEEPADESAQKAEP